MSDLDVNYLRECLHYDPSTGFFTWRERPVSHFPSERIKNSINSRYAGKVAGSHDKDGYIQIHFKGGKRKAHRLAFLFSYGRIPDGEIDHINHIRDDNRIANLREATSKQNRRNKALYARSSTGVTGVRQLPATGMWQARIRIDGVDKHLGNFTAKESAVEARANAEKFYGFHVNHGEAR